MRFVVLTQYFAPEIGAPQTRLAAMVRALLQLGHEVEIVTAMPNYPKGEIFKEYQGRFYMRDSWEGVAVHRLWIFASNGTGIARLLNFISFMLTSIVGLLRCQRPDFIFVNSAPLFLGVSGWVASLWFKRPFVFNVSDLWPDSVKELGVMKEGRVYRMALWLEAMIYKKAWRVTAVTEGIKTTLLEVKKVPPNKVLFLPNGADVNLFVPKPPNLELQNELGLASKKIFLYAGTTGVAQGCEVAVRAIQLVGAQHPDAAMVFLGGGTEWENLKNFVSRENMQFVWFIDFQPPEFVVEMYATAVAGVATLKDIPLFEGARPSKVFPNMACAKPVLYSGAGEGARLIQLAKAGIVTAPEDEKALAEAMLWILEHPKEAAQMGEAGRAYVQAHLAWPTLVNHWLQGLQTKNEQT